MSRFFSIALFCLFNSLAVSQVWDSLGVGTYGNAKHFNEFDGKLYVGGIDTSQGVSTFNMATWDGNIWESVGGGIDGQVFGTAQLNNKIFIGGAFIYAGGPYPWPAPKIYHLTSWNGSQYENLDFPDGNYINTLDTFNNELYIGTTLVTINNHSYYGILKYNDTTWSDVGGGLNGFPREVNAMTKYNGELIVGGFFLITGTSLLVNNIARWSGNAWNQLGNGLNYGVRAFVVDSTSNNLYVGGSFTYADTTLVNHIAMWDGSSWHSVGSGVPIIVQSLCIYKNELYAGGGNAWGLEPSSLYKWNGSVWIPIIPAPIGNINCLKVYQETLYVSGGFSDIGGVRYSGIAKYTETTTVEFIELSSNDISFSIHPNPTTDLVTVNYKLLPSVKNASLLVTDLRGRIILEKEINITSSEINLELKNIESGSYHVSILADGIKKSVKAFIKL